MGREDMLEEINNLELNAYLSASQVEEFQHLASEQKTITAGMAGLLEQEKGMKSEDTKVASHFRTENSMFWGVSFTLKLLLAV